MTRMTDLQDRLEKTVEHSDINWTREKSGNLTYADHFGEKRAKSGVLPLQSVQTQIVEGSSSRTRGYSERIQGDLQEEATSSSVAEKFVDSKDYACSSGSLLTLHPWLFRKDNFQVDMKWGSKIPIRYAHEMDANAHGMQPQISPKSVGPDGRFRSRRKFMRRHASTFSKRPLDPVHNCLIPRMYEDDSEFEDIGLCPVPSQSLLMRPFYISDGSQIISKMNFDPDFCSANGLHRGCDGSNLAKFKTGFTPLPECSKGKSKGRVCGGLGTSVSQKREMTVSLPGSSDGLLFFLMGCTVGIVLTMMTKKGEVEKLNAMLKQSENLVKDLEEELELKDSVTVKELVNESFENQRSVHTCLDIQEPNDVVPNMLPKMPSTEQEDNENRSGNDEEKSVPLSTIEAELQAELERLELNMNVSSLEESTSLINDLNDGFISHVIKGELKEDDIHDIEESQSDSCGNFQQSSTSRTPPANYSVSPKELSLRLYELNQCRLEERIKELEDALYHRQNYPYADEVKREVCYSGSDVSSSANQDSPVVREITESFTSQPLCINLSGDALDAYNEAYDEFVRITHTEENSTSFTNTGEQILGYEFCDPDGSISLVMGNGNHAGSLLEYELCITDDPYKATSAQGSHKVSKANYENSNVDDSDDEEGRILIQQIVERTKKGSPVVFDVKKLLLSMDK